MSKTAAPSILTAPVVCISNTTSSGVNTMPRMLDNDALTIAAGTLPWAIEVNAIDDCTVDATRVRNNTPVYRSGVNTDGTRMRAASPRSGKATNVAASTSRCSRQCRSPCMASVGDSRAP
jgi:hypothetical protein